MQSGETNTAIIITFSDYCQGMAVGTKYEHFDRNCKTYWECTSKGNVHTFSIDVSLVTSFKPTILIKHHVASATFT